MRPSFRRSSATVANAKTSNNAEKILHRFDSYNSSDNLLHDVCLLDTGQTLIEALEAEG